MSRTFGKWHISTELALPADTLLPTQEHTGDIVTADDLKQRELVADGVFVRTNQPVAIRTADCIPLVLMTDNEALALHVSRHTLLKEILDHIPDYLDPERLTNIWIGPHICEKHLTFSYIGEGLQQFMEKYPEAVRKNTEIHLSLKKAVLSHITQWNIDPDRITDAKICTYESDLPSYKRWVEMNNEGEYTDRFFTIVRKVS